MIFSSLVLNEEQNHISKGVKDFAEGEHQIIDEGAWLKELDVSPDVHADLFETAVARLRNRVCVVENVEEAPANLEKLKFQGVVPHKLQVPIYLGNQTAFTEGKVVGSEASSTI